MKRNKQNLIMISGLYNGEKKYSKIINSLSREYHVYLFFPDYKKSIYTIVKDLIKFIKINKIKKSNFIAYSYGAVVFRLFYIRKNCSTGYIVEIAPINKLPKLLRRARGIIPFMGPKLKRVYKDICFLNNEIFNITLPRKVEVIAGDRGFDLWRLEE